MKGPLDKGVNASLMACMRDGVPVLAIVTVAPRTARGGARYRLLGPARVVTFDTSGWRFLLEGHSTTVAHGLAAAAPRDDELEEVDIRSGLVVPFQIGEKRERYVASRAARDQAFQRIVLEEYRSQCAVCQSIFVLRETDRSYIEAQAAHIISVERLGPDDPRNGVSLCRRHHWAFDSGFFCVTDSLEVRVSPAVGRATRQRFDLEEYDTQPLVPPVHETCRPSLDALAWHRREVFKAS